MARYSQEVLERIKSETDLPGLVRAKGVKLERHGKDLHGLCPFHKDTKPSLVLTQKNGHWLWHCLGECDRGGDSIEWVKESENVSFRHAVELQLNGHGHTIITEGKIPKGRVRHLPPPIYIGSYDQTVLDPVV